MVIAVGMENEPEERAVAEKTVAVVGASGDRAKYGNKAVRAFRDAGWTVFPIHPSLQQVEGMATYPSLEALPVARLDRVSFYGPPHIALGVLDEVARKQGADLRLKPAC